MGRRKIDIKPIQEHNRRRITLKKRAGGLVKKAMELSVLCECEIGLFVMSENSTKLVQYTSSGTLSMEEMMLRWIELPGLPEVAKTNEDLLGVGDSAKNASTALSDEEEEEEGAGGADGGMQLAGGCHDGGLGGMLGVGGAGFSHGIGGCGAGAVCSDGGVDPAVTAEGGAQSAAGTLHPLLDPARLASPIPGARLAPSPSAAGERAGYPGGDGDGWDGLLSAGLGSSPRCPSAPPLRAGTAPTLDLAEFTAAAGRHRLAGRSHQRGSVSQSASGELGGGLCDGGRSRAAAEAALVAAEASSSDGQADAASALAGAPDGVDGGDAPRRKLPAALRGPLFATDALAAEMAAAGAGAGAGAGYGCDGEDGTLGSERAGVHPGCVGLADCGQVREAQYHAAKQLKASLLRQEQLRAQTQHTPPQQQQQQQQQQADQHMHTQLQLQQAQAQAARQQHAQQQQQQQQQQQLFGLARAQQHSPHGFNLCSASCGGGGGSGGGGGCGGGCGFAMQGLHPQKASFVLMQPGTTRAHFRYAPAPYHPHGQQGTPAHALADDNVYCACGSGAQGGGGAGGQPAGCAPARALSYGDSSGGRGAGGLGACGAIGQGQGAMGSRVGYHLHAPSQQQLHLLSPQQQPLLQQQPQPQQPHAMAPAGSQMRPLHLPLAHAQHQHAAGGCYARAPPQQPLPIRHASHGQAGGMLLLQRPHHGGAMCDDSRGDGAGGACGYAQAPLYASAEGAMPIDFLPRAAEAPAGGLQQQYGDDYQPQQPQQSPQAQRCQQQQLASAVLQQRLLQLVRQPAPYAQPQRSQQTQRTQPRSQTQTQTQTQAQAQAQHERLAAGCSAQAGCQPQQHAANKRSAAQRLGAGGGGGSAQLVPARPAARASAPAGTSQPRAQRAAQQQAQARVQQERRAALLAAVPVAGLRGAEMCELESTAASRGAAAGGGGGVGGGGGSGGSRSGRRGDDGCGEGRAGAPTASAPAASLLYAPFGARLHSPGGHAPLDMAATSPWCDGNDAPAAGEGGGAGGAGLIVGARLLDDEQAAPARAPALAAASGLLLPPGADGAGDSV